MLQSLARHNLDTDEDKEPPEWMPTPLIVQLRRLIENDLMHAEQRRHRIHPDRLLLDNHPEWQRPMPDNGKRAVWGTNGHLEEYADMREWLESHYDALPHLCPIAEIVELIPPPMREGKSPKAIGLCIRQVLKRRGAVCFPREYRHPFAIANGGLVALWALANKEWIKALTPDGRRIYFNEQRRLR